MGWGERGGVRGVGPLWEITVNGNHWYYFLWYYFYEDSCCGPAGLCLIRQRVTPSWSVGFWSECACVWWGGGAGWLRPARDGLGPGLGDGAPASCVGIGRLVGWHCFGTPCVPCHAMPCHASRLAVQQGQAGRQARGAAGLPRPLPLLSNVFSAGSLIRDEPAGRGRGRGEHCSGALRQGLARRACRAVHQAVLAHAGFWLSLPATFLLTAFATSFFVCLVSSGTWCARWSPQYATTAGRLLLLAWRDSNAAYA